jgi:D-alanyl-lipoteichoic acid acyltransferase DltB (MBOAT superfamily)
MYGVQLILYGLFKKVAIADGLAVSVNSVYNSSGTVSSGDVGFATLLFAFQIFCDFSGYTDIARGVAKLFGIELTLNFDLPYFSRNPSEFWRRWHISLSSWLRDYLYIELGGNRKGNLRTYLNLIITMVLGGLWHGAAANFMLWGAYQGTLLAGHRLLTGREEKFPTDTKTEADAPPSAPRRFAKRVASLARIAFFFLFVCYGWLLFRATSLEQIIAFTGKLVGLAPSVSSVMMKPPLAAIFGLVILLCLQFAEWVDGRRDVFRFLPASLQGLFYAVIIFDLFMGMSNVPAQFIYFQF